VLSRIVADVKTLADLGEFGLIDRIARIVGRGRFPGVVLGIGDDAALLRPPPGEDLVVSTDVLGEGVHFRFETQAPRIVGRRALAVNLSDLAAMGARPLAFTLALTAPPTLPVAVADALLRGLVAMSRLHACPLVGGNVARGAATQLAVTVLGAVRRGHALRRDALRPGDRLFVTGRLGTAALVVARAERGLAPIRHVPVPRIEAGRALARMPTRGACIDLSDGLASDLGHLLEASGVGAEIDAGRIPLPSGQRRACAELGLDPLALAVCGGEDYELLFSLRGGRRPVPDERALGRRLGVVVTEIGRITREPGVRGLPPASGFRHF